MHREAVCGLASPRCSCGLALPHGPVRGAHEDPSDGLEIAFPARLLPAPWAPERREVCGLWVQVQEGSEDF